MIDERSIEEAAEKQLETIQPYSIEERLDRKEPISLYEKNDVLAMFKTGINWFKENLWHDASEEPKRDKGRAIILVELHLRGSITYTSFNLHNELSRYKVHLNEKNVARWLYIEDLMKGGK